MKKYECEYLKSLAENFAKELREKELSYGKDSNKAMFARGLWFALDIICDNFDIQYSHY